LTAAKSSTVAMRYLLDVMFPLNRMVASDNFLLYARLTELILRRPSRRWHFEQSPFRGFPAGRLTRSHRTYKYTDFQRLNFVCVQFSLYFMTIRLCGSVPAVKRFL
jgi:hypothetical protein